MKKLSKIVLLLYFCLGVFYFFKDTSQIYQPFLGISAKHWLGTNSYGRDIFATLFAGNVYIFIMLGFGWLSFALAIFLGSAQGYLRGIYDFAIQRIYEVVISIPFFFIIILVGGWWELNIFSLGLLLLLINWTFLLPYIRVQALSVSTASYIKQMQDIGYSPARILIAHIFPNVYHNTKHLLPFVLILFATSLSALDFLGLSQAGAGSLIVEGVNYLNFPLILLSSCGFLIVLLLSLLGIFNVSKYHD
ncbi:MAG: ABC transporter permease subunit [Alphaproteobacteria bacterium]|jgi:ABC-type dipeptide/oligopeptide/nickel transport system permease subunit|nr:ABC transporter permease subunit [Alphaproteobacteria bacterium]